MLDVGKPVRYAQNIAIACSDNRGPPTGTLVFDCETTMEGRDADPMPYGPKGARTLAWACGTDIGSQDDVYICDWDQILYNTSGSRMLVGHNIKFDWQHLLNEEALDLGSVYLTVNTQQRRSWQLLYWDTSIAEYILTAQAAKFASLDDLAEKYLAEQKDDVLKRYFERGLRSQDVPKGELEKYVKRDVFLTSRVMHAQWTRADKDQRALIMVHSALAVIFAEAEYRGLRVNKAEAVERRDEQLRKANAVQDMVSTILRKFVLKDTADSTLGLDVAALASDSQFNTPRALSMMLFGLPRTLDLEAPLPMPIGRKKKAKLTAALNPTWPVLAPEAFGAQTHADGKSYLLDEKVLTGIVAHGPEAHAEIAGAILDGRGAQKEGVTYYQGLLERQEKYGDDTIHHTLNLTTTATGRSSSSNPNSQNQPERVKEVFEPRSAHIFCEFDFKQLEVWALAILSGDETLLQDLRDGTDIHFETGRDAGLWKTPKEMTKDSRRRVKSIVFGLIYGGGAKTLSEQSGAPESVVKGIIRAFYGRYPDVKAFHNVIVEDVAHARNYGGLVYLRDDVIATPDGTKRNRVMRVNVEGAKTGRTYAFQESTFTRGPWLAAFSPTNIKNYPVQGFATGDIVPLALVLLDSMLEPYVTLCTAVHDAGLLELPDDPFRLDHVEEAISALPVAIGFAAPIIWGLPKFPVLPGISAEFKKRWGGTPVKKFEVPA